VSAVEMLGYRDSGMVGTPANQHAESFHQANLGEATARLVRLIRKHRPSVVITYNAYGGYGHPDHIKVHQVSHEAFERAAERVFEALRCHRTQIAPDSFALKPPPEDAPADMIGVDHYVRVRSLVSAPDAEDDLFAGLW